MGEVIISLSIVDMVLAFLSLVIGGHLISLPNEAILVIAIPFAVGWIFLLSFLMNHINWTTEAMA